MRTLVPSTVLLQLPIEALQQWRDKFITAYDSWHGTGLGYCVSGSVDVAVWSGTGSHRVNLRFSVADDVKQVLFTEAAYAG